jgi:hypothetical protein
MSMTGNLLQVTPAKLEEILIDSSVLEDIFYTEESDHLIDIDKAWEGIFFLLTGCSIAQLHDAKPPFSQALFSLQLVDEDQDMGYGPAHFLTDEQVKEVSLALTSISIAHLKSRYNESVMMEKEIYPEIWNEGPQAFNFLYENFEKMKGFYKVASEKGNAVITFLN